MADRTLEVQFTAERGFSFSQHPDSPWTSENFLVIEGKGFFLELNGRSLIPITHPSIDLRLRIHGAISPLLHTFLKLGVYFETGTYSVAYSFVQITVDFLFMICPSV
jgi:hypothetical protein